MNKMNVEQAILIGNSASGTIVTYDVSKQVDNWDKAIWELVTASEAPKLADRLDELTMPTLVISGDDDRLVPVEQSLPLGKVI